MVVDAEVVETTRRQFGLQQPAAIAIRFFGIEWLRRSDPHYLTVNNFDAKQEVSELGDDLRVDCSQLCRRCVVPFELVVSVALWVGSAPSSHDGMRLRRESGHHHSALEKHQKGLTDTPSISD